LTTETCDGCRFDGSHYSRIDARKSLRTIANRWRWATEDIDEAVLACRPAPTVWSPTEYAVHAADVVSTVGLFLHLMTTRDLEPIEVPAPVDASPDDRPPATTFLDAVSRLEANALRMDDEVAHLTPNQWSRTVVLDGETVDTGWVVRHAVHDASHHLMDIGRGLHDLGVGAPRSTGTVHGVFLSKGGVPKLPIDAADVGYRGVDGDRQETRQHHGRVWQALCLWSTDVIDALQAEGHPVAPGSAGENVTISGVDWSTLRPGVQLSIGDVLAEVSAYAEPCSKNAGWFVDGDFGRMSHDRQRGVSRLYASVLRDGVIRPGDPVVVEPD
jgi:MOSC domain-containing protein YiiM